MGAVVVGIVSFFTDGNLQTALRYIAIVAIIVSAVWLVIRYLKWATTNFVITSDRIIFRSGVIAKSGIEIPLERVNNVLFSQSIFERILGAGDLLIESGGEDGQQRFTDIKDPAGVQNLLHSEVEKVRGRRAGSGAPAASTMSVPEQLERLEGLLQRGSITQEEFDLQKRRLFE
jgi:uncharacterized membrane protein YdbT with pleckstrin-like domain